MKLSVTSAPAACFMIASTVAAKPFGAKPFFQVLEHRSALVLGAFVHTPLWPGSASQD
jgi:hypothetical protein